MSRKSRMQNRSGIALVVSIIAVVVVAALVTGVMAISTLEQKSGENARRQNQAFAVADAAAGEVVASWNGGVYNNMATGTSSTFSGTAPNGTGTYTGTISRINNEIFHLDVVGKDRYSSARQRVGMLVKLKILTFDIQAALTTQGNGQVGGSAAVSGIDTPPWTDCPLPGPAEAGIRHPNASQLNFIGGCNNASCVTGSPAVETDPAVNNNTFFSYGDADWAELSNAATLTLPAATYTGIVPTQTSGVCNKTTTNWGEPLRPATAPACTGYFPTIYVSGDLKVTNGRGQGILLVNGDLELAGGFEFDGVAVVRGRLKSTGTGNHITGGVLAANVDLDNTQVLGNAVISYSSCAILRARNSSSPGAQFRSRGWMQVY
ncbi:MAG TPA: PilX N-terminal domain-containing pilus assembly protein [Gemmatimonadaceae bacterium]|nr:PilX N-terminal domain-containing pilus assembly protein [Gemmatimonadaceae bacterium]